MSGARSAFVASPEPGGSIHRFDHQAMACQFELFVEGEEAEYAQHAAEAAFQEVDRLERLLSRFLPSSDLFRVNAAPPGEMVRVGLELVECVLLAAEIYEDTGGAFDITVGAILDGRRGPDRLIGGPGDDETPLAAMSLLRVDPEDLLIGRTIEGISLDLGGIGKGFALDRVRSLLADWGIDRAMIHSGQSTVLAIGSPEGADAWTVQLRDPRSQEGTIGSVLLRDHSLSGSGTLLHGQHIVDPRTGLPAGEGKLATWAMASSAARSDALSTAFMVMELPEIQAYCGSRSDIAALILAPGPGDPVLYAFGEEPAS